MQKLKLYYHAILFVSFILITSTKGKSQKINFEDEVVFGFANITRISEDSAIAHFEITNKGILPIFIPTQNSNYINVTENSVDFFIGWDQLHPGDVDIPLI